MLFFDHKKLRLNKLSEDLEVSRSTMKNDLDDLQKSLMQYCLFVEYDEYFYFRNHDIHFLNALNRTFVHYLYLYQKDYNDLSYYQRYVKEIIDASFRPVQVSDVITWGSQLCDNYKVKLSDDEYKWYLAQILILVWYIHHQKPLPPNVGYILDEEVLYQTDILELEKLIHARIDNYYRGALVRLIDCLDGNQESSKEIDIVYIQYLVSEILELMSNQLGIDFSQDQLLREGLLKYAIPLMKRLNAGYLVHYDVKTNIPHKDKFVYDALLEVLRAMDHRHLLTNNDEVGQIAVHFIASMRRLRISFDRRVLIVCYHEYGTSTFLRDVVSNEFKVKVVDVIPSYKLSTYKNMDNIDYIISTLPLKNHYEKQVVVLNSILTQKDYEALLQAGIEKRDTSVNYYSIKTKLDFLDFDEREKVLKVLKEELGHAQNPLPKKTYKISDILIKENIQIKNEEMHWKDAILKSSNLLVQSGSVSKKYGEKIIETIQEMGFYCVTDEYFALFHGKENADVYYTSMSLIINKREVFFDDKKVKIIFCLASKDKKDQIPAMILLMRMMKKTDFLIKIEEANTIDEAFAILCDCEKEVLS